MIVRGSTWRPRHADRLRVRGGRERLPVTRSPCPGFRRANNLLHVLCYSDDAGGAILWKRRPERD